MQSRYIYASTLVKTREQELLSPTQLEMLLTAKSLEETKSALEDTYLAPYLHRRGRSDVAHALEDSVADAHTLLAKIAPDPGLLNILWIKYDFYNLRTIIKGTRAGMSSDDMLNECFSVGLHHPEILLKAYTENTLGHIDENLKNAAVATADVTDSELLEHVLHTHYFNALHTEAQRTKNRFIKRYVTTLIDVFNIRTRLRQLARIEHGQDVQPLIVEGGTFTMRDLETYESISESVSRMSNSSLWKDAMSEIQKKGNFSVLEKVADEYILDFLERESYELFSLAPLFSYFTALKNNAQTIRAIIAGKQSGLSERDIRYNLRRLYA